MLFKTTHTNLCLSCKLRKVAELFHNITVISLLLTFAMKNYVVFGRVC